MSDAFVRYPVVGGGGGGGDVAGPSSSTDNALAVFDGLTGKLLKNSTLLNPSAGRLEVAGGPLSLFADPVAVTDAFGNFVSFSSSLQTMSIYGTRALTLDPSYIAFDINVFGRSNRGLGTANNEAWPFEAIGGNTLALGYSAGDALPTYVLGQIVVKPGTNLTVSADKALFSAGIGVGNSAAATTPGSVVRKIEIFNASGTSLGFIPVYDTIT